MGCHRNELAAIDDPRSFKNLPLLRYPDEACCNVDIECKRPRHRQMEIGKRVYRKRLPGVSCERAQIL